MGPRVPDPWFAAGILLFLVPLLLVEARRARIAVLYARKAARHASRRWLQCPRRKAVKELSVEAIRRRDGSRASCVLRLPDRPPHVTACEIEALMGHKSWMRADADYFATLALVRRDLEAEGWLLSCYGASRHVYPSAMSRDMALGLKAYKTYLGQPGGPDDMVDIFATGPDVEPATVDEQKAFHEQWFRSLSR